MANGPGLTKRRESRPEGHNKKQEMKKTSLYKFFVCASLVVGGMTSCVNNWLDESPSDGLEASTAVQTVSDLSAVRTGMYAAVKGNSSLLDYYGRLMFIYGDMRGEDVQYNWLDGSNRGSFYYYMTYQTADNFGADGSSAVWQTPFIVISRANRLIAAAEGGTLVDAEANKETVAQYEAEAKVIRAMALFDLTRIYGKPYTEDQGASLGAPIVTEPIEDPSAKPARSTVAECYKSIEGDLSDAINSGALPEDKTQGYVNLWVAKALQVRVYMTKGEWQNALTTAQDIIEHSPYKLWTSAEYANAWDKTDATHTNEMIFELLINNTTDWTDREGIAYCYRDLNGSAPGYGDVMVTKAFSEMLASDPKDVRNEVLLKPQGKAEDYEVYGGEDFLKHGVFINKMPPSGGDVRYANVPLLRLSEVYLSAAEAAFQLGEKETAAKMLNAIITNRTTDASKEVTASTITLDRIYIERRKELVGEGQRYFDVLRRGETVTRYTNDSDKGWHDVLTEDARTFNRDSKKALPLIPVGEMNVNPNMQQNPLY